MKPPRRPTFAQAMGSNPLDSAMDTAQARLRNLKQRMDEAAPEQRQILADAIEELAVNLEEMQVLGEELHQQNDELISTHQALMTERQRYQDLFQQAPDGYIVTDGNGAILEANSAVATMLGMAPDQLRGQSLMIYVALSHHSAFRQRMAHLEGGAAERFSDWEMLIDSPAKGQFPVLISVAATRDAGGRLVSLRWVLHDLSALRRSEDALRSTEAQLRQSQKIEAIGRLAGGVAHDFNNMMTAVLGYSDRLLKSLSDDDPRREAVLEIERAGERAARLTKQLLAFGRKQVLRPEQLSLNSVIEALTPLLARLLGEDIRLEAALFPGLGTVNADRGQLEQVIMNLAVNARDAMPKGGTLTIATHDVDIDEAAAAGWQDIAPGQYVLLTVTDTGEGMSGEIMGHIFEPFFTTKQPGEGTGLGLSTVYGIVKQSGGDIQAESSPGRGAKFEILFPCQERPAFCEIRKAQPERKVSEPPSGTGTILLIEDEQMVRQLTALELRDMGYTVLEAADAGSALEVARSGAPIDLILSDVVLPGMSGQGIVGMVRKLHPAVRVVYMSGYGEKLVAQHGALEPGVNFVEKPFTPEGLARKIREVLDAPAPRPNGQG